MNKLKAFTPVIKAVGDDGTATIVIATLNEIDSDGDVTLPGFFGKQDVVVLPAHDRFSVPLGKGRIYEDGDEAIAEVAFNLDIAAARDWHSAIKFDSEHPPSLQEYSYGFRVLPGGAKSGDFGGRRVQFLQPKADGTPGADVYEVSPVLKGAGIGTRTLAVKALKQPNSEIRDALCDLGEETYGGDSTYVWVDDYDIDESWVVFDVSAPADADRLVRVSFTRDGDSFALGDDAVDVERTVAYQPSKGDQFAEHAKSVIADIDGLIHRFEKVIAFRTDQGKSRLADSSVELLDQVDARIKTLAALREAPPDLDDEARREFARYVAITNGVHL